MHYFVVYLCFYGECSRIADFENIFGILSKKNIKLVNFKKSRLSVPI